MTYRDTRNLTDYIQTKLDCLEYKNKKESTLKAIRGIIAGCVVGLVFPALLVVIMLVIPLLMILYANRLALKDSHED